jgi:tight adherence protein B
MRLLLSFLPLLLLLPVLLPAQRARGARLRRLAQLTGAARPVRQGRTGAAAQRLLPRGLVRKLQLLGFEADARTLLAAAAGAGLVFAAAALLLGPIAALAAVAALAMIAVMLVNVMVARRLADLAGLMPGFFDRVRQLLIVGNSLPVAFVRTVQAAQPRLARAFAPALRRMHNGASFSESIRLSSEEIDLYEVRLFATAVSVNMRFGGSLTHALNNLVSYLRKRASIERELRASTAQIRASAWILGLLPLLVAALIVTQNQDYARWFLTHSAGRMMLGYCLLSQIAGTIAMRAVTRTVY